MLRHIEHLNVDYDRRHYAGHPRQGGLFRFGERELAVIYWRAPCAYQRPEDVQHDYSGYHARAQVVLARSLDGGQTWDRKHDVVIFDETRPIAERRAFLAQVENNPGLRREVIDLNSPDAAIYFGRTWAGEGDPPAMMIYAIRSADRGRTWESIPTRVRPVTAPAPGQGGMVLKDGHPLARMPDGTHLGAMSHTGGVWLYGSDDQGLTWDPIAQICADPTGLGRPTYAGLILLPSGELQCYSLNIGGWRDAIQMCHSLDGGYSWSVPRPIVRWGRSPWAARRDPQAWATGKDFGKHYRSPWALRLADGRIVVIFARRKPPYGLGVILSDDAGRTWSDEQVLRCDASVPDLGYPVAVELPGAPGRVFTAYYYTLADGNGLGGTRFIAGSYFEV